MTVETVKYGPYYLNTTYTVGILYTVYILVVSIMCQMNR